MKVLVTGSAGFIGSNLTEDCVKKGWEVVGVDNFATSDIRMSDPERFNGPGLYSFARMDINDTERLAHLMKGCDAVFHLAALPRVPYSVAHPIETNEANTNGTLSVLEASRQSGVKRVMFSCSSSIFGGVDVHPTPESMPMKPLSPYALQKATGAEYCRLYSKLYGLETAVLIYYNVYGKYQTPAGAYSSVITAFFDAAVNGKKCRIDGDGLQSRDFCHVDNVVRANMLAATYDGKLFGERFNIANGETHSVLDIFDLVCDIMQVDLEKYHVDPRQGDPRKSQADIAKAEQVLKYRSSVGFVDGMRKTADWWKAGCPV